MLHCPTCVHTWGDPPSSALEALWELHCYPRVLDPPRTCIAGARPVKWGLSWAVSSPLLPTFGFPPISGSVQLLEPYLSITYVWGSWGTRLRWWAGALKLTALDKCLSL